MDFKPMELNRLLLTWLCLYPTDANVSIWKKLFYINFTVYFYLAELCGFCTSLAFFVTHATTDLEKSMYALFQTSAFSGLTYMFTVVFFVRRRIVAFLKNLDSICEANSGHEFFRFFEQANNKSQTMWKIYLTWGMAGFPVSTIGMAAFSVFVCQPTSTDLSSCALYLPYRITLPWNQLSATGYSAMILLSASMGNGYLILNGSVLLLFVSICWYHRAFSKRFQQSLLKLNRPEEKRNAIKILCELIDFQNTAKEWFFETNRFFSSYLFIQLIACVVFLACAIFNLDLQVKHFDATVVIHLLALTVSCSNLYVYCLFGKVASDSYEHMTRYLFESNWIDHPVPVQKYLIMMIENAQIPLHYDGSGITLLNLQTFTNLIRRALTFYMMFKTLASS